MVHTLTEITLEMVPFAFPLLFSVSVHQGTLHLTMKSKRWEPLLAPMVGRCMTLWHPVSRAKLNGYTARIA